MAKLVLDTNSLLQCISRRSRYHDLWVSFLDGRNTLCVSTEILEEYAEILERKTSLKFAELALSVITNNPHTQFVTSYYHFRLIAADPDDDKFVDCAVAGNAKGRPDRDRFLSEFGAVTPRHSRFFHKPLIGQKTNQRFVVSRKVLIPTNSKSVFSVLLIKYLV